MPIDACGGRQCLMRSALLAVVVLAASGACGSPDRHAEVLSFNYCGNVCAGGGDEGADFVRDLVATRSVTVVVMQEVCRSQAEFVRAELAKVWDTADLAYVATFQEDLDGANRCVDDDYGMAVLAPAIAGEEIVALPNPGLGQGQIDERKILCADVVDFTACTTHLVRKANDAEAHTAQVAALTRFLEDRQADRLVLAGDINEPDPIAARGFEIGHHRLDHAYASKTFVRDVSTSTASCDCSDHPALLVDLARS